MQTSEVASQAIAILVPVMAAAGAAQGVAVRALGTMISERLARSTEGREAWNLFRVNPHNDSLVRHLLQQEVGKDAAFRDQLAAQLLKAEAEGRNRPVQQGIGNNSSGNTQVAGNNSGKIANNGSTIWENVGNKSTTTSTTHKKSNGNAVLGVVAIVVIVVIALVIYAGVKIAGHVLNADKDGGLTANSTCQQFLNTDEDDERQALADIGISYGYSEYSNPLALPEIQYECGGQPNMTLGALIQRDGANT
jgi:hypothetical protein